jgi:seryl-tRNA synthetase
MHDIKAIRSNPQGFDRAMARRGYGPVSARILGLDDSVRFHKSLNQERLSEANKITKQIGNMGGAWADNEKRRSRALKEAAEQEKGLADNLEAELNQILCELPNELDDSVPKENAYTSHEPAAFLFEAKDHATLGSAFGFDPATGAALAGSRFPFLRGDMARLHRAVGQFMLDVHVNVGGFTECIPPVLVKEDAMFGTDKLPKFAEDSFKAAGGRWLIPTGEVPLVASVSDRILMDEELPIRLVALTQCFRSEVGSLGRDATGLLRQHQFEKVELVSITRPEDSAFEHGYLRGAAMSILDKLDLPYRVVLLGEQDTGFGAAMTFDLEVWFPGMKRWVEVASCSNCKDFQARRMNTRFKKPHEKARFVHTLNASGLAVGRTVAAIIENYQHEDGCITIPPALRRYFDDARVIIPTR